jgi:hypothetical protein
MVGPHIYNNYMYIQSDELATIWLDDEDVRAAIHAKPV